MADFDITPKKRKVKNITFTLGDEHVFTFTPPKDAEMMLPVIANSSDASMATAPYKWFEKGLSEDDYALVLDRLADKDDDLDLGSITTMIGHLTEKAGKRPTK